MRTVVCSVGVGILGGSPCFAGVLGVCAAPFRPGEVSNLYRGPEPEGCGAVSVGHARASHARTSAHQAVARKLTTATPSTSGPCGGAASEQARSLRQSASVASLSPRDNAAQARSLRASASQVELREMRPGPGGVQMGPATLLSEMPLPFALPTSAAPARPDRWRRRPNRR